MHDELRIQLEGGLELLEDALHRYQELRSHLASLVWKRRIARARELVLLVAESEPAVLRALAAASKRPGCGPLAAEVLAARAEVVRLVHGRVPAPATATLPDALHALDAHVGSPRRGVHRVERWQAACEALPPSAPVVSAVAGFGAHLEHVFSRPITAARVPVSPKEWQALHAQWARGCGALDEAWRRVERRDPTGGLARALHRRARRLPRWRRRPARHEAGPLHLIHAEFWRGVATARAGDVVASRVAPVVPTTEESLAVLGWLLTPDGPPPPSIPPARAALLELVLRRDGDSDPAPLLHLAMTADRDRLDPDWARVRDALVLEVRAASTRRGLRLEVSPRDSLAALLMCLPLTPR